MKANTLTADTRNRGFSLLEILISLVCSSLIILLLSTQYLLIKKWVIQIGLWLKEEAELLTLDSLLRKEVHQAGYTPCAPVDNLRHPELQGYEPMLVQSHALTLRRMASPIMEVKPISPSSVKVLHKPLFDIDRSQPFLIADCFHAEIVRLKSFSPTVIQFDKPLLYSYESPTHLGNWLSQTFTWQPSRTGLPCLYYQARKKDILAAGITGFNLHDKAGFLQIDIKTATSPPLTLILKRKVIACKKDLY